MCRKSFLPFRYFIFFYILDKNNSDKFAKNKFQHFTPDGKNIISIGNQHDQAIVVWDWKNQKKIASNRLSSKVNSFFFIIKIIQQKHRNKFESLNRVFTIFLLYSLFNFIRIDLQHCTLINKYVLHENC